MRIMIKMMSVMVFLFLLTTKESYAFIEVSGDVSGQTFQSDSTYIVTGNIIVYGGSDLTILPGAVIKFMDGTKLEVRGSLAANGLFDNSIVFTSVNDDDYGEILPASTNEAGPGDWEGIYLSGSYSGDAGAGVFDHCRVRYGGSADGAAKANIQFYKSDSGSFVNSICEYSATQGIRVSKCTPMIADNEFISNAQYPLLVYDCNLIGYPGNSGSGNGINAIAMEGTVSGNLTWQAGEANFPYLLTNKVTVNGGAVLNLNPGTILKFLNNAFIDVRGKINALGKADSIIVLTSFADDSYGGDVYGDDATTLPDSNHWGGIYLYGYYSGDAGVGVFDYCRVRYGGSADGEAKANIKFYQSDSGSFINSVCEYSETQGIRVTKCTPVIANNEFISNAQYPLLVYDCKLIGYPGNCGSGNGVNAIAMEGTVTGNLTWQAGETNFPYLLTNKVTVNSGAVLNLNPGTILKFLNNAFIDVRGKINALGKADSIIVFTSFADDSYGGDVYGDAETTLPDSNHWGGIYLYGHYSGDAGVGVFDHCRVRYGGSADGEAKANIQFYQSDSGSFINSVCEFSETQGIRVTKCTPVIANSEFISNAQYPLLVYDCKLIGYPGNSGSGNGVNAMAMEGTVSGNLTWQAGETNFPYLLTNKVTVNSGAVLNLNPGTILKFLNNAFIDVRGKINALGKADSIIVLTSFADDSYGGDVFGDGTTSQPDSNHWGGIYLYGHYSGDAGVGVFDHCRVRYGGSADGEAKANIQFYQSDSGSFVNSICEYSETQGIRVTKCTPVVADNEFISNAQYPLLVYDCKLIGYPGNRGSGNGVNSMAMEGTVSGNLTWQAGETNFPYLLTNKVTVNSGSVLNLNPGTILKFLNNAFIDVRGKINALGKADSIIVFTSFADDSYGGDVFGDGTTSQPDSNHWGGIYLYGHYSGDAGVGVFDHCRVRYGGSTDGWAQANILFYQSDSGSFVNSICEYSKTEGIRVVGCSPIVRQSRIQNNQGCGLYSSNGANPDLGLNDLTQKGNNTFINNDNGLYQIYNNSTNTLNAFYNYWGYTTKEEIAAHIFDNEDDSNFGEVLFEPWLTADPTYAERLKISLLTPLNGDTLSKMDSVVFIWRSEPSNMDSAFYYQLRIFSTKFDTTIYHLSDTSFTFNNISFLNNNEDYFWTVWVADTVYSVITETFSFHTPAPVGIERDENNLPGSFALHQNYPNPFNPSTKIRFDIPHSTLLTIKVYNSLGQVVSTLIDRRVNAGTYITNFDASSYSSGQYFVVMKAGRFFKVHKMILLK